jgi:hypothetical protein
MANHYPNDDELERYEERPKPERWRDDPVSNVAWAAILIWAGIVFLARNMGWLVALPGDMGISLIILIGAGMIILLEAMIGVLIFKHRRQLRSSLFLAVVLTGNGFGSIFGWSIVWPFILIAVGLSILFKNVWNRN